MPGATALPDREDRSLWQQLLGFLSGVVFLVGQQATRMAAFGAQLLPAGIVVAIIFRDEDGLMPADSADDFTHHGTLRFAGRSAGLGLGTLFAALVEYTHRVGRAIRSVAATRFG
jgi:hypothetical protein